MDLIKMHKKIISNIDGEVEKKLEKHTEERELLQTIPGVKEISSAVIIAEIGLDMNRFPSASHLGSWAGMSPGNNESAGKKKNCRTTQGNKSLKHTLIECAWAATRTKDTYLRAKYYELISRLGKKKALVVIGHKILIMCYHIFKRKNYYTA